MKLYKSVNLKPEAFAQLQELAALLSSKYSKVHIGNLVASLVSEKYNATIKK